MTKINQLSRRNVIAGMAGIGSAGMAGCSGGSPEIYQHDKGETFTVGSGPKAVEYVVEQVTLTREIGSSAVNTEAEGVYLVVILSLENIGNESFDILSGYYAAYDPENDRTFDPDVSANSFIDQDPRFDVEGITWNSLQPGIQQRKAIVFDVAAGNSYAIKIVPIGAFSGTDTHYVALGNVPG